MNRELDQMKTCLSKIGFLLLPALVVFSCLNAPDYPDTPFIEFISLSKDTLRQGQFLEDSLRVRFRFEDGDGDIGRANQDDENNVFFIDERTGTTEYTFGIPAIPQEGAGNGVEGEVKIILFNTCCIYEDGTDPCVPNFNVPYDTVQYRIYIVDQAGHRSNDIFTPPIILKCF